MVEQPIIPFEVLRGGTPEGLRSDGDKPRSPASYCAQFGIPIEDVREELERSGSHMEMLRWCRGWATSAKFRERALDCEARPTETEQQRDERLRQQEERRQQLKQRLHEHWQEEKTT